MARATTGPRRPHSASGTAPERRAIVRDFTRGGRPYEVSFDVRTAYDFLISLEIGDADDRDLTAADHAWLKQARAGLSPEQLAAVSDCFGDDSMKVFHGLADTLVDRPELRDAASVVRSLEGAGTRGITRAMLVENLQEHVADDLIDRAIDGDPAAIAELQPSLHEYHRTDFLAFLADAEANVERLLSALRAWLPLFQQVEGRVADLQSRDVAWRKDDRATLDDGALIEKVTGGLRWLPDAQVSRVILAPTYFSRPFNYVYQGTDWRLFCYPMADAVVEQVDSGTPPPSVVRLYRALGDVTRMRILKLLSDRDWYLTELATQLELSKPTMKHHLALMRAAGLVTVTEEGTLTYYSLRRERLEEAGLELRRFIN
jgi:DNA-binding transcriptional ArsR family regulator